MTRLVREDIFEIEKKMKSYDEVFQRQTGCTMQKVAMMAAGIKQDAVPADVAVVSVTSGLGIISGFADTVAAILAYYGIDAAVMEATDVAGLQQACYSGRKLVFMADDDIFTAFGFSQQVVADNGNATGQGFAAAMVAAMELRNLTQEERKVLVLGAGPVGRAAAAFLLQAGVQAELYDTNPEAGSRAESMIENLVCLKEKPSYRNYEYIFDATTEPDLIDVKDVSERTIIAAPGMPCGITPEARSIATVIHNPLELGVLTMYYQCIKQLE